MSTTSKVSQAATTQPARIQRATVQPSVAVPRPAIRQRLGAYGEALAALHVTDLGWQILARNWRCAAGEVDLIAMEPDHTVVFCEVKTRRGTGFGDPLDAVTWSKQRKLRELVGWWLSEHHAKAVRIDAIGVLLLARKPPELNHVRNVA